jgi:hypothetical protein
MAYTAKTWSALRQDLAESTDQNPFWDNQEALDAVNEALLLWNLLTGTWRRTVTLPTIANQYEYVMPATMLYRTRITFNAQPLSSSSREEFNLGRPRWRTETTASGGDVPTRPTLFAPISLYLIYIWPADAVGGGTLSVDGISATPQLVEDGDTVDLGNEQLSTILDFALHVLTFKKQGQAFAATQPLFKAFLAAAAEKNSLIKTSTIYRRVMGLDRRDLKPYKNIPTDLDQIAGVQR